MCCLRREHLEHDCRAECGERREAAGAGAADGRVGADEELARQLAERPGRKA